MKYQEQPGHRRGMGDHGIEDTKEPQIPSSEDFFTCWVLCFKIVTFKCFSFRDVKRKGKEWDQEKWILSFNTQRQFQ